jgi:predicted transcriptional regulator
MLLMNSNQKTSEGKDLSPESLIDELLKMDRLLYLKIIREEESITSLEMTRKILASRKNLKPRQVKVKEVNRNNPNINRRLRDLAELGILNVQEGRYSLSPIGSLVADELTKLSSNIEILRTYEWFFGTHDYTVIPPRQFHEIHQIQFAKQCENYFEYRREIEGSIARAEHDICIATEYLHDISSWIIAELKEGTFSLKLTYQFKEPFKINSVDEEEKKLWRDLGQEDLPGLKLRYIALGGKNPMGIRIIDGRWAMFNLLEFAEEKLNRPRSFHGTQKEFIAWIEDVFSSIWNRSKPFNISKVEGL